MPRPWQSCFGLEESFAIVDLVPRTPETRIAVIDACLKAADEALYRGKAAGRNRVVVAA